MSTITLPLNPHNPAHYLAALGITILDPAIQLSWNRDENTATFTKPASQNLASELHERIANTAKTCTILDTNKKPRPPMTGYQAWINEPGAPTQLRRALTNPERPVEDKKATCASTTPFDLATGQKSLGSVINGLTREETKATFDGALTAFCAGIIAYHETSNTGFDPVVSSRGGQNLRQKSSAEKWNYGNPVVEYLAIHGIAYFPTFADGSTSITRTAFTYPIWTEPLTKPPIQTLIGQTRPDGTNPFAETLTAKIQAKGKEGQSYNYFAVAV